MSAPEENWGGDDIFISGPSHAAEAAVIGEEGALVLDTELVEQAYAGADTIAVGTPSSEASTVKLYPHDGVTRKPRTFTQSTSSDESVVEPQDDDDDFSPDPTPTPNVSFGVSGHRNVNPSINTQARYQRDRPKNTGEPNVQPRFELFLLGDGEKKVTETPDTRIPSSSIFTFHKEDHTLGNMLRSRLLQSSHVSFAGYRVPHPLFSNFELRIQTDGTIAPRAALVQACRDLVNDLGVLGREFTKEWELRKMVGEGVNGAGGE